MSVKDLTGRSGHRWREARAACFALWGTVCVWCGHDGAGEADHVVPMRLGGDPYDPQNLRPMHGSNAPCPECLGERTGRPRCCNQEKQAADKDRFWGTLEEFVTEVGSV